MEVEIKGILRYWESPIEKIVGEIALERGLKGFDEVEGNYDIDPANIIARKASNQKGSRENFNLEIDYQRLIEDEHIYSGIEEDSIYLDTLIEKINDPNSFREVVGIEIHSNNLLYQISLFFKKGDISFLEEDFERTQNSRTLTDIAKEAYKSGKNESREVLLLRYLSDKIERGKRLSYKTVFNSIVDATQGKENPLGLRIFEDQEAGVNH